MKWVLDDDVLMYIFILTSSCPYAIRSSFRRVGWGQKEYMRAFTPSRHHPITRGDIGLPFVSVDAVPRVGGFGHQVLVHDSFGTSARVSIARFQEEWPRCSRRLRNPSRHRSSMVLAFVGMRPRSHDGTGSRNLETAT